MSLLISRIGRFCLVAAVIAPGSAWAADAYKITNLGGIISNEVGAGTEFAPTAINDSGTIIGTAYGGALDRSVVALISPGLGSTTTFSAHNASGPIQLEGYKVNNNNDFVGDAYAFTGKFTQSPAESFIWAGGALHLLNVAPGVDNRAKGINDSQAVVGGVEAVTYSTEPPFTLGVTAQIPELTGGNYSVADINDSGVIVGTEDANFAQGGKGFIDNHGVVTTFAFPGAAYTYANGISNNGAIVGTWYDQQNFPHGYIYDNGSFTDVELPNNIDAYFEGISDAGQIVGEYVYNAGLGQDGFLLDPVNTIPSDVARLTNSFVLPTPTISGPIDPSLVDVLPLKDFRLTSAPEPSTWAMMILGFGGLGFMTFVRRRRDGAFSP